MPVEQSQKHLQKRMDVRTLLEIRISELVRDPTHKELVLVMSGGRQTSHATLLVGSQ